MTDYNWQAYNYDKYNFPQHVAPPGQLLTYPIQVGQTVQLPPSMGPHLVSCSPDHLMGLVLAFSSARFLARPPAILG